MTVLSSDLVASTLRRASRVVIKVADLTASRATAAMNATGLVDRLTLLVAERTVVVFEHLNRQSAVDGAAWRANHDLTSE
jgi:hypothetical protein